LGAGGNPTSKSWNIISLTGFAKKAFVGKLREFNEKLENFDEESKFSFYECL
jgi:hypothetical protein